MRKFTIAVALASTALATPAVARDNSPYVGLEGGGMIQENTNYDYTDPTVSVGAAYRLHHHVGYDVDLIGGYDFGMFRLEGEVGYKRAGVKNIDVNPAISLANTANYDASGHSSAVSAMVNGLADFGDNSGFAGFVGAGVGVARVHEAFDIAAINRNFSGSSKGRLAWQAVAGVRYAVSPDFDIGLKYRYFNVDSLRFDATGPAGPFNIRGRWHSHSLLASLIYNFAAAAPPPPPPPPPAPERG
jgi:opacity protein-like surface antigen